MATKLQIIADSNSTYVDNSTGNITPTTVKALNTDWINSTVFAEQTSSMSVATASFAILASTASFVAGNVASASTAALANTALTASSTPNAMVTASVAANIITFTKGNGTTFALSIAQSGSVVSSSYSDFSNQANSASLASNSLLLQGTGSDGFVTTGSFAITSGSLSSRVSSLEATTSSLSASIATVNSRVTVVSSSLLQVSASYIALSASYNVFSGSASTRITDNSASISAINTATASFAVLANNQTFSGKNTFNSDVTMSNVMVTGTASVAFLNVVFQSSSIIYASGSNQLGDASNDTQTLYGTVNVITGPLVVTGSANFKETITGSISGNAGTATSASYALSASFAQKSVNAIVVTNNGTVNYILDGVAQPVVTFVPGETYKFDTSGVVGSHPLRFSTTANGPIEYSYGVTTGTNYTEIEVDYATSSSLFYYCTLHSGMGNQANTLRSEQLIKASQTSSMSVLSASFATTASFALNAGSDFPFSGSAVITGSLVVTGSSLFLGPISGSNLTLTNSGSILLFSTTAANNRGIENMLISDSGSRNNIIGITQADVNSTGSFVVSGSGNLISITGIDNIQATTGALFGVSATQAIITSMPRLSGSNATKTFPIISTSTVNSQITINDNRVSETNRAISITNSNVNSTITANIASGSISIQNSGINGSALTLVNSGSGTSASNTFIISSTICAATTNIIYATTSSAQSQLANSLLVGAQNRLLMTGSSTGGGTAVAGPCILDSIIVGRNLIVTGSSASSAIAPIALVGSFNLANGLLNDAKFTRFAVGTGAAEATRRTSFHVSASGMVTCFDGLTVTGSQVITGSLYGSPVSQSVASSTASLNLRAGNFFNLTLPASANTYITASGQLDGQTINLKITQGATSGSVSLGAGIKQVSGSSYTVTAAANTTDILTFISFDNTGLYVSSVKNLI